jgi:hypothetical protein
MAIPAGDEAPDHYFDGPYLVFTAAHHLRRGACCGNGCRHCPFEPRGLKGCTAVAGPRS